MSGKRDFTREERKGWLKKEERVREDREFAREGRKEERVREEREFAKTESSSVKEGRVRP